MDAGFAVQGAGVGIVEPGGVGEHGGGTLVGKTVIAGIGRAATDLQI